jgi:hypothetical protein
MNDKPTVSWYHGSPFDLEIIASRECVTGSKDLAAQYALGKIPGSKGYGHPPGWIYELAVTEDDIQSDGINHILTHDMRPVGRCRAVDHKCKSASENLGF